jgi:hypothetical protein
MSDLVPATSLREFFKALLLQATAHQHVELADVTEFYVVNLLAEFAAVEKLFSETEDGRKGVEPLAVLYYRALQQEREEKIRTLRRLGDLSLYRVGFFSSSLRSTATGPDYYIQMGGSAYRQVAGLAHGGAFAVVYTELWQKFRALVEVFEEIAARGMVSNGASGALKVYESWLRTGSDRLERILVDAGMVTPKNGLYN